MQNEIKNILNLFNQKQFQKAKAIALNTLNKENDPQIYLILGMIQSELNEVDDAIESIRKSIKIKPINPDAYNNLGTIFNKIKNYDDAILNYKKAIENKNNYFQAYFNLGNSLSAKGLKEEAKKNYLKSIEINPEYYEANLNLGIIYHDEYLYDKAISCFKRAIQLRENSSPAYNNLGNSLLAKGEGAIAIDTYLRGIEIDKNNFKIYSDLGNAYKLTGDHNNAIASIEKSIKLNPNFSENYSNLANIFNDIGEINKAIELYKLALKYNPKLTYINYNIAMIFYKLNQLETAIDYFKLSKFNDHEERILQCQYKLGLFEEFNKGLDKELEKPNTSRLVASLSAHASINLKQTNDYDFCKNPLDFILKEEINDSSLLERLLRKVKENKINHRHQGLLNNGEQSSGNIFDLGDSDFTELRDAIFRFSEIYFNLFKDNECEFIRRWPKHKKIRGWYVNMKQNGFLKPHIHEGGWLSGSLYLSVPKKNKNQTQGNIEFGLHGYDYPIKKGKFEKKIINILKGDIVMFPSSLFHNTIPFKGEERICIAFDINP